MSYAFVSTLISGMGQVQRKADEYSGRIDDVEDNSTLRRGIPVAHGIFGIPQTINSANYVYFMALQELTKLNKPELLQVFTGMDCVLFGWVGSEVSHRLTTACPSACV